MITDEHHGAGGQTAGPGGRDWASAWDLPLAHCKTAGKSPSLFASQFPPLQNQRRSICKVLWAVTMMNKLGGIATSSYTFFSCAIATIKGRNFSFGCLLDNLLILDPNLNSDTKWSSKLQITECDFPVWGIDFLKIHVIENENFHMEYFHKTHFVPILSKWTQSISLVKLPGFEESLIMYLQSNRYKQFHYQLLPLGWITK